MFCASSSLSALPSTEAGQLNCFAVRERKSDLFLTARPLQYKVEEVLIACGSSHRSLRRSRSRCGYFPSVLCPLRFAAAVRSVCVVLAETIAAVDSRPTRTGMSANSLLLHLPLASVPRTFISTWISSY